MNTFKRVDIKNANVFFLSFGWIGFLPKAPGTFGSLATIPVLWCLSFVPNPQLIGSVLLIALIALSTYIAEATQKKLQIHDPGWIVIDEVLGMLTTWIFFPTNNLVALLIMFVLFRFFDIIKFWPASYFDKKVHHGFGTIMDDVISGIYSGVSFMALNYFYNFS